MVRLECLFRALLAPSVALLWAIPFLGCLDSPSAPLPIATVNPQLQELLWAPIAPRDGGVLMVDARPVDSAFRMAAHERVEVLVESDSGDVENLLMKHFFCPPPKSYRICDEIAIGMYDGYHAANLAPLAERIHARLLGWSSSGRVAGLRLFEGDVDAVLPTVRSWPGVKIANEEIAGFADGPSPWAEADLVVAAPLDYKAPTPGDGHIQATPGTRLTLTYQQPDGSSLQLTLVIPQ